MPVVGRLALIVITRDRRIRTRPAELRAYWECGIRSGVIDGPALVEGDPRPVWSAAAVSRIGTT
jgi:hypothetical protein